MTEGGGDADEVVLLGMTDGLISRLDGELIVRPTGSVLRYSENGPVDPVAAGHEQDVDAVLSGSLDTSDSRRILKLRLIRVRDGLTLWQDSFKGGANDLSRVEQEAGNAAAKQLRALGAQSVAAKPAPAVMARANDPAYQLYLRGRYFWNRRTVDGLNKSTEYFRQAIAADPNYALAYAGLADSYALLASFSVEPGRLANADARSAALSAIQLDPTLAEPHASLGMIYFFTDWNLTAAEREFERAIQLNPNYATAHHWYALDLAAMGRFPQALYEIHIAQKLDPLSLIIGTNVGWIEYLSRDYASATRDLDKVLELDPNFVRARTRLGMVEMATGNAAAAVSDLREALALSGDEDPWVQGLLGDAEARAGSPAAAERVLTELKSRSATQYVPPISRGLVLLGLDRKPEAITAFAQSVDDHSTSMVYARVDPALDAVRDDPAFIDLLTRLKP
jgi:tetratricopeptide (TPR) repeat protein